jgi:DNA-binding winged helix-turn-helix (wHTH) protein/TolB-like protein
VQFAEFEFDPASGELRRGSAVVRLEPQPARVLAHLVERAGQVVTRTELQQAVWGGETFVDFEHGLNYCIAQIRTALGDSAAAPRFIETLPRRGYRFVAPVTDVAAAAGRKALADSPGTDPHGPQAAAPDPIAAPERSLRRRVSIGAIALALIGAAAWTLVAGRYPRTPERPVRIAVVPFDNETGRAEYDLLAQMLTDATVARLAADPERLAVIGNAAVLRAPRRSRDLTGIGRALAVGHVVLGQVQQIDGRLRITTHLIRVRDQAHLWAHRFEPSADETPSLDRDVSEAVAGAVAKRLLQPSLLR